MKKLLGLYDKSYEWELKSKLISYTGIESKYITFIELHIDSSDFIHIIYIDDTNYKDKKDLVIIHGWGGSTLTFFKTFKELSKHYKIIGIDLPGMGCSSRSKYQCRTLNEYEDYFLDKLKFCLDRLLIDRIVLLGHSFGAYICALFAVRHIEMIEKLILLSPVGLSSSYINVTNNKLEDIMQYLFFKSQITAPTFYKYLGVTGSYIFNQFVTQNRFKGLSNKEEFVTYRDFLKSLLHNYSDSDKSMFTLFNDDLRANKPILYYHEVLKDLKTLILYGDEDWNPVKHGEEFRDLLPDTVEIEIVSNSGHIIQTDNYQELSEKIINFGKRVTNIDQNKPANVDDIFQKADYN